MSESGILTSWEDSVGRITLDSGEELRVGQSALRKLFRPPTVGSRVLVHERAKHPLGGFRATSAEIVEAAPPPRPPPLAITELCAYGTRITGGSVPAYQAWLAAMPPTTDEVAWLFERIRHAPKFLGPRVELERLADTLETLRGVKPDAAPYGVALSDVGARAGELTALVEHTLVAFVESLSPPDRTVDRVRLHRLARRLGLPALALAAPPRLHNEPLGSTDGLDPAWLARLERWAAAAGGTRSPARVTFGANNHDALYDQVLGYELVAQRAFPRELAALLAIANGVMLDNVWYVAPLSDWEEGDHGLVIGPGSSQQGTLTLSGRDLLRAKVIDRDDDGSKLASFASFAALIDALLGD